MKKIIVFLVLVFLVAGSVTGYYYTTLDDHQTEVEFFSSKVEIKTHREDNFECEIGNKTFENVRKIHYRENTTSEIFILDEGEPKKKVFKVDNITFDKTDLEINGNHYEKVLEIDFHTGGVRITRHKGVRDVFRVFLQSAFLSGLVIATIWLLIEGKKIEEASDEI